MHSLGISTVVPVAFDFVAVDDVPNLAALFLGELYVSGTSVLDDACSIAARKSVWLVSKIRRGYVRRTRERNNVAP